ncbi:MAG: zinc ribbon domain-containing protein [Candidatus Limnocylindrales bacterium]
MPDVLSDILANPLVGAAATAIVIVAIGLWLAAAWWAYTDAGMRSDSGLVAYMAAGWILISTPLTLPFALAIYRLARPQQTAADTRAIGLVRALSESGAAPACPACSAIIDSSWLRCPACAAWLAAPCSKCGVSSAPDLEACPYCGSEAGRTTPRSIPTHEKAAASETPAAAIVAMPQRRIISSLRPASYAASRESSSASL